MITNLKIGYDGRFGNQIFQFASLIGIADKIGTQAVVPLRNKQEILQTLMDGKTFRSKFELDECFEIGSEFFTNDLIINQLKQESTFHFDPTFFEINDSTSINGYFQSDKYFKHCKNKLIDILTFKKSITETAQSLLPNNGKELVSLHVRRGDYTTPNPYHPVISDIYIDKSLKYFEDEKYHIVVFSDDKNWCFEKWGNNDKFSIFESDSHFVDFCAMSICSHHITSNSSFSWWSSFLCKNENKIVLAPKKWFGPAFKHYTMDDLYRDDMIVLDETIENYSNDKPKINIFTICTGKYTMFFDDFYKSCEDKFLKGYQKKYFVFTDGQINNYDNVVRINQSKLGWPFDTMMRFKMFNSVEHMLDGDYVYFFNVNMQFLEDINDEVIPGEDNDYLMGVNHPGYHDKPHLFYPYERRTLSNFYIPYGQGKNYFQGCFNGGRKKEFMDMSRDLEALIDLDLSKGIIPEWHDESALNWFYKEKNPLLLEPSYAYPELWDISFEKKIIQRDKSKLGGHDYLRN